MLTYDELLKEIRLRSPAEQLALLEELAHSLRAELTPAPNTPPKNTEELGWPPGYFESVYGSLRDTNFERPSQGDYDLREDLD